MRVHARIGSGFRAYRLQDSDLGAGRRAWGGVVYPHASDAVTDVSLSLMTGFIMNAQLMLYPHASDAVTEVPVYHLAALSHRLTPPSAQPQDAGQDLARNF